MIALVWSAIQSKLAGPIAAAVAIALACFLIAVSLQNAGLKHALKGAQSRLTVAQEHLGRCQSNRATLEASLGRQNAAVAAMSSEAERRAKEGEAAMRRARAGAVEANRRAEAIRGMVAREQCGDDLILRSLP